ncbi:hypothetical protein CC86DRAFT_463652 [Ophiobolus disseminans]|uniref:Uncharacterized protein n=1 Tax=Ophiobolus disseminans TaxID=1469910 RepID=A0A6A7AAK1_9PLEO|nr:hypothetical protein CC86DRAFT_463652 [Ophiobolus disseminans]
MLTIRATRQSCLLATRCTRLGLRASLIAHHITTLHGTSTFPCSRTIQCSSHQRMSLQLRRLSTKLASWMLTAVSKSSVAMRSYFSISS